MKVFALLGKRMEDVTVKGGFDRRKSLQELEQEPGRWMITVQPLCQSPRPFATIPRFCAATRRKTKGCTMTVQPGELWLADIRFTDASASKIRPVLVLWLTLNARPSRLGEYTVLDLIK
jgi:hypothetical protein